MTAYFTRRLLGALLSLFGITFILHTIFWITPGSPRDVVREFFTICRFGSSSPMYTIDYMIAEIHLDQPFPVGYFLWLFDPAGTVAYAPREPVRRLPPDLDISFLDYRLTGSGLLTGDFGVSTVVAKGQPVFAFSLTDLLDLVARLLLPGMALATVQRIGHRPHAHVPYHPRVSTGAYVLAISGSYSVRSLGGN